MNKTLKSLLDKPMDRQGFLRHLGVGAMMVSGGGMVVKALSGKQAVDQKQTAGYGSSAYGGVKKA